MNFIQWTEEMSVGSELLDGHHKIIVDCLNQLHPLLDGGHTQAEIHAVLARLEEFILVHFSEEEQQMKASGYPAWHDHKLLHDRMYDLVYDMKSDIEQGKHLDARHLFELIYDWLLKHILGEDKKYVSYLSDPDKHPMGVWTRSNGRPC